MSDFHRNTELASEIVESHDSQEKVNPEEQSRSSFSDTEGVTPIYFKEIKNISLLTSEEELKLGREIREAQTELFSLCLGFRTSFEPFSKFQKILKQWKSGERSSGESIEVIFKYMKQAVSALEEKERLSVRQLSFIKKYHRHQRELHRVMGEMVRANLRLAVNIAKRYVNRGVSFSDLIQEGNLGLLKAVSRYDYTTGYRFSTYASWWIRQTISRAISDHGRTIRVPVHLLDARKSFYRSYFNLVDENGREPTANELAERSGLSKDKILKITNMVRETISLETPISDDGDLLRDLIENKDAESPLEAAQDNELFSLTETALSTLDARERKILSMRFGIGRERVSTLEKVGETLNISRERVRQLEKRALERLRKSSHQTKLRNYLSR